MHCVIYTARVGPLGFFKVRTPNSCIETIRYFFVSGFCTSFCKIRAANYFDMDIFRTTTKSVSNRVDKFILS